LQRNRRAQPWAKWPHRTIRGFGHQCDSIVATYLHGYVAFYGGDYKTALDELLKANQNDPFIECMIGQTYEKLGDKDKTLEFYGEAATAIAHHPAAAYAVPFSKKRLASLGS
jgi:hypothetical protein